MMNLGMFGEFGGMYVPETLMTPLREIEAGWEAARSDPAFSETLNQLLRDYAGRPTPLYHARGLSLEVGCGVYLKREDLLHGGAHKTNNAIGQGLLAQRLRKRRIIAETGAGQHGVATAMIGALLGLPVEVYMGAVDMARQQANVQRMELFGATVHAVHSGDATLKDAINEAMRDWIASAEDTYYLFGTAAGPHPFPTMVAELQAVIGSETRRQILVQAGRLPDAVCACVGGGSNAMGLFSAFVEDADVTLLGAEAAGAGLHGHQHAATLCTGHRGVFHGMHSVFLQNADGHIAETHSVSAGLDYPGVGPQHADLQARGRGTYVGITDEQALAAFHQLARREGIIAALESCHAIAAAMDLARTLAQDGVVVINVSGRGDKDLETITRLQQNGRSAPATVGVLEGAPLETSS